MLYKKDNRKTNFLSTKLKNILGYIFAVACSLTNIVMFFVFVFFPISWTSVLKRVLERKKEKNPGCSLGELFFI